ncbi:NADPH-dependent ferric siderophore reductase [Actinoalloteichus hoggarensis]|uniref:Vibriobactin utilization protein ViuB n=1 Tax=Actinoalloteichus hoggarensis TaxID=1470176 RepID=A0A221W935_9PSEU|nr:siderophore-interacting protein [Actinoalloteichus hoggarensis]ASO21867.1 Vibriobactin utilization protein ViuB [Actinoalloteichus hoggarensis]MBB5922465.1 NADPH-dependent ferric siderophore reductase [Actinoalloteichus hoggarensis]
MTALPIRHVHVTDVRRITPRLVRVTFGGDDLADLGPVEPDQQVKLYFPRPGQTAPRLPASGADGDFVRWYQEFTAIPGDEQPWQRSYTLRAHHPERRRVDVDFVLHEHAGPATRWARSARPGDALAMFGPSADFARPIPLRTALAEADAVLLAGDETALPAIGSLLESLPEGTRAVAYVEVADAAEEQRFDTLGAVTVHWLHRGDVPPGRSGLLLDAIRGAELPAGRLLAWLACEASEVRALRRHLVTERGLPRRSVEFTGHWRLARTQDDAPTAEDLAEARERLADAQAARTD